MNAGRQAIPLALLALFFMVLPAHGGEMASVARDGVILRQAPDGESKILCQYDKGLPLKVLEAKGDWRRVSDFEKDGGWLPVADLNKEPHMVVCADKNTGVKANARIRQGPGEEYPVIGEAVYGAVFATLGHQADWVKVRHDSGLEGWVKRSQVWGFW